MVGVAVLGAGYAGTIQLRGWREVPNARLIGVYDPRPERLQAAARAFGVPAFSELDALLDAPGVDAVDIATPVGIHREMARAAASRRKAVLCQKPLSTSLEDAEGSVRDCEDAGVRLMVNENWRWRPWYRAARELIDAGRLGRLTYMHLGHRSSSALVAVDKSPGQIFEKQPFLRSMKPLILFELGPHHLDVTRYLFGAPQSVFARTLKVAQYVAGEEIASLSFACPGRIAQVELSWATIVESGIYQPDTLVLEGTDGTLRLATSGALTLVRSDGEVVPIELDIRDFYQRSWTAALTHFAAALEAGTPFETPGRENLEVLRMVFGGYRSAAERSEVDLTYA